MTNVIVRICLVAILLAGLAGAVRGQTMLERRIDSLFVIASSAEIQYQDQREPAMDSIAAFGAAAVPFLIDKFETRSAWQRWTVIWILQRIGPEAVPDLVRALDRTNGLVVQRVCWALGDIADSTAVPGLLGVVDHSRWQVRDQAIRALGMIGDDRGADAVRLALADSIGQVRKSAVVACGLLGVNEAVTDIIHLLDDEFYGARLMAVDALLRLDTATVIEVLTDSLPTAGPSVQRLACQVLGEIGSDPAMRLLLEMTDSPDPSVRAQAAVALVKADPQDNCLFRALYYDDEPDRLVKKKIEAAVRTYQYEDGSS